MKLLQCMAHIIDWKSGTTISHLKPARFICLKKNIRNVLIDCIDFPLDVHVNAGFSFVSESL